MDEFVTIWHPYYILLHSIWGGAVTYLIQMAGQTEKTCTQSAQIPHTGAPLSTDQTGSKCLVSHTHTHTQRTHMQTTSGIPDCPTCPFMDLQWLMDQCLSVCPEAKKSTIAITWKQFWLHLWMCVCACVVLPHEPLATHKIQLWKTRHLYSRLTTSTHKHLQGSEPSVVTDCSISPVCVSLCECHISSWRH